MIKRGPGCLRSRSSNWSTFQIRAESSSSLPARRPLTHQDGPPGYRAGGVSSRWGQTEFQVNLKLGLTLRQRGATVKKYLNERGFRILRALDQVAERFRSTPARVALAWLSSRPGVTAPIASATSLEQLGELIEATRLELDAPAIELLNQASA